MIRTVSADQLELAGHIRPGDWITWGQGAGEPVTLTEMLVAQRAAIGKVNVFIGLALSDTIRPEHTDFITPASYGAVGTGLKLARAGVLKLLPSLYSSIWRDMECGRLPIDVVFVQISPPGPDGSHSLGFCNDYLPAAMRNARLVIAEINPRVPWTHLDRPLDEDLIDFAIASDREPPPFVIPEPGDVENRIARHVAGVIDDGATVQYGVGAIPLAVLAALGGHRDLGLHSGMVTEHVVDLVEAGVITNARKPVDTGIGVGAIAFGGKKLADFMHDNPAFQLHRAISTHGARKLAQIDNLVAINSALEVDLFGQVNGEQIGGDYLGTIGGQVDYMHAAATNARGLSIIALPSTLGKSGASRITDRLGGPLVTTTRGDVDVVVTEHGVADLRGKFLEQRARALIDVAAPEHRERLAAGFSVQFAG